MVKVVVKISRSFVKCQTKHQTGLGNKAAVGKVQKLLYYEQRTGYVFRKVSFWPGPVLVITEFHEIRATAFHHKSGTPRVVDFCVLNQR